MVHWSTQTASARAAWPAAPGTMFHSASMVECGAGEGENSFISTTYRSLPTETGGEPLFAGRIGSWEPYGPYRRGRSQGCPTSPSRRWSLRLGRVLGCIRQTAIRICLALALVGAGAAPAAAQSATTLISNVTADDALLDYPVGLSFGDTLAWAQAFTTGANAHGYSLSDVIVYIDDFDDSQGTARVSIYSEAGAEFGGWPGSGLYVLTNPSAFTTTAGQTAHTFTAPGGATLDPDTTYYVVVEAPAGGSFDLGAIHTRREHAGGASGWSIGDRQHIKINDQDWDLEQRGYTVRLAVRGTVLGAATTDADAPSLHELAITSAPTSGSASPRDTYGANEKIEFTATFDEAVTVGSDPALRFQMADDGESQVTKQAAYVRGSGTTQLVFQYTVQAADSDDNGIKINANGLNLDSNDTIKDAAGNNATLTHAAIGTQSAHKVDGSLTPTAGPPTKVEARGIDLRTIFVRWKAPADDFGNRVTSYKLEYSADGSSNWRTLAVNSRGKRWHYDDSVSPATRRYYRVKSVSAVGDSLPSAVADAATFWDERHCDSNWSKEVWCTVMTVGENGSSAHGFRKAAGANYGALADETFEWRGTTIRVDRLDFQRPASAPYAGPVRFRLSHESGNKHSDGKLLGGGRFWLTVWAGMRGPTYRTQEVAFTIDEPGAEDPLELTFSTPSNPSAGMDWRPGDVIPVRLVQANESPTVTGTPSVTTEENTTYTFAVDDFNFSDSDDDALVLVRLTSLPATGELQYEGSSVELDQGGVVEYQFEIPASDIEDGDLTYVPPSSGHGNNFASFGFKVSDGPAISLAATMTINVTETMAEGQVGKSDEAPSVTLDDLPRSHDGSSPFTVGVSFSGAPEGLRAKSDAGLGARRDRRQRGRRARRVAERADPVGGHRRPGRDRRGGDPDPGARLRRDRCGVHRRPGARGGRRCDGAGAGDHGRVHDGAGRP